MTMTLRLGHQKYRRRITLKLGHLGCCRSEGGHSLLNTPALIPQRDCISNRGHAVADEETPSLTCNYCVATDKSGPTYYTYQIHSSCIIFIALLCYMPQCISWHLQTLVQSSIPTSWCITSIYDSTIQHKSKVCSHQYGFWSHLLIPVSPCFCSLGKCSESDFCLHFRVCCNAMNTCSYAQWPLEGAQLSWVLLGLYPL